MKFSSAISALLVITGVDAFSSPSFGLKPSSLLSRTTATSTSSTSLNGRKKGGLAGNVAAGGVTTKKKKKVNKSKNANNKNEPVKVSSSLSSWAASLDNNESASVDVSTAAPTSTETVVVDTDSSSFQQFEDDSSSSSSSSSSSKKTSRRERTNVRKEKDASKNRRIEAILSSITERIESNNLSIDSLLLDIKTLVKIQPSVTLKALMNKKLNNYSLAWVGADDAICHVGTGLHKVPLARLQDIFFSLGRDGSGNAKTATLLEVIRILGPFPNVRNTLQGSVVDSKSVERDFMGATITEHKIKIMYDSMMDGLGKEINAGKEGNIRYVDLNVLYADENALVCVVPNDDDDDDESDDDEFGENGENVLLFLKEDDLDLKLEELRAA